MTGHYTKIAMRNMRRLNVYAAVKIGGTCMHPKTIEHKK